MQSEKTPARSRGLQIFLLVLFILIAIIFLFPIYYMLIASFKESSDLFKDGYRMIFQFNNLTFSNYVYTTTGENLTYLKWYWNSFFLMVVSTVLTLAFSSLSGYALGAYKFKGQKAAFVMVLIVMMMPLEIMIIPLYQMMIGINLIDTKTGSILPFMVAPTAMFFFRQYISGLDKGYMDAGRIDGCTEFGIFFKIMVPLMKPAFGAMTILLALRNWNAYLWPMIVFRSSDKFTLPVGLASLISSYGDNYAMLIPGSVLAFLPLIVIFLCNQKQFISGLTAGGIKG